MIARPTQNWIWQLPRSKREVTIANALLDGKTLLATMEECEGMNITALMVQFRKREKLLQQLVGTLYKSIVVSEMHRIEELVEGCRRGYSEPPQELLDAG